MRGHNDAPNMPPPPPIEVAKQAEYDLGWEDCARFYGAEIKRLRDALEPFADIRYPDAFPDGAGFASRRNGAHVSYGDIKRARELLLSNV